MSINIPLSDAGQTNTDELISIIIPVYNSEKYLHRILTSIFNQTYSNFEIIFAYDEKTTDNSLNILQKYAEKHHNILIDIATDVGPGGARNRGLKHASGEFVVFVDADDILHPNYLRDLHHIFVQYPELDVGFCRISKIDNYDVANIDVTNVKDETMMETILYTQEELLVHIINRSLIPHRAAWPYILRRKYLSENNICFSEQRIAEDQYFVFHVLCNTLMIGHVPNVLYYYVQCPDSICHTINYDEEIRGKEFLIDEITPLLYKVNSGLKNLYYSHDTYELLILLARNNSYRFLKTYLSKEKYDFLKTCFKNNQLPTDKKIFCKNIYLWYIMCNVYAKLPRRFKKILLK